jgi:phosphatidate cytidylyltransferase
MTWTRVFTAVVLIPIVVGIVSWGSTALVAVLTGLVTVLALLEFFALGEKIGMRGYRVWTCICAVLFLLHQWGVAERFGSDIGMNPLRHLPEFARSFLPAELLLWLFVIGAAGIAFASRRPLAEILPTICISAAALLFVAMPLSFLVLLHTGEEMGPRTLLFTLVLVWVGDTAAYFVGRTFGRHLMAPQVSPKKTWEGAVANLLGSLLVAVVFYRWMNMALPLLGCLAVLASVAGQAGDLLESAYKRSAGVKDSGVLLPGHGGVLDRIDALILAAPIVWYYLTLPSLFWRR